MLLIQSMDFYLIFLSFLSPIVHTQCSLHIFKTKMLDNKMLVHVVMFNHGNILSEIHQKNFLKVPVDDNSGSARTRFLFWILIIKFLVNFCLNYYWRLRYFSSAKEIGGWVVEFKHVSFTISSWWSLVTKRRGGKVWNGILFLTD